MVFKLKPSFFLELGGDAKTPEDKKPAVIVAPVAPPAAQEKAEAKAGKAEANAAKASKGNAATSPEAVAVDGEKAAPAAGAELTTAESIAAELAAAAASRPAPTLATFAPDCLVPGAAVTRRRRGGANLAGFRSMAAGMFRS
ncbi:hypothetical protein [Synechococcus sp. CS-1328]|uniref:hypothetical protein n=1 Tax=Synechococcus sp. CS-1328 TaxID=2847976 RepID=UPI00223BEBDD|nr:hypothetical protein [Synechococcus sp. CS-1328]MCT0225255.1 hypothetical protein [Synechococcus sp. CS-1328]